MRQAVMISPGKIELREVEIPADPAPDEILLRIKRIGICGSDIHVWHGKHPFTSYPIVQGHEYCGEVIKVGEKVTLLKPGDKATARPQLVCGTCSPCKKGHYNVCMNLKVQGFQANGCAQDYFVIPEERAVKIPDNLTWTEGAFIEPVAVAAHSTGIPGDVKNENVVVFGAGTIGNLVAQFLQARGAGKVLVTDINEFKLNKATESGIKYVADLSKESFEEALKRVFGKDGFRIAFEAAGAEKPIIQAVNNIENSGTIVILGVFDKPAGIQMSFVCEHELKILGSMMYKHEDFIKAVDFVNRGLINLKPLLTKEFPFEAYNEAYDYIDNNQGQSLKIMMNME